MTDETVLKLAEIICDCVFWTATWCTFWIFVTGSVFTKVIANNKKKEEQ